MKPHEPRSAGWPAGPWMRRALPVLVIGAALVVVLLLTRGTGREGPGPGVATSTAAEGFVLPRLQGGGVIRLADLRGRPVVVNFFASWCTACQGELPGFRHVEGDLAGRATFVFVNSLETGDGPAMAHRFDLDALTTARDVGGLQASGLHDALTRDPGLPNTAFYDAAGRLRFVSAGALSEEALRAKLQELFGIAPAGVRTPQG